MPLKRRQERLITIAKILAQPPWSQAPTLARQSGWLTKEIFTYFFYKQIRLKCVFGYCRHFNNQQYEKSLKNFKIFSVAVVLYGAGQVGS